MLSRLLLILGLLPLTSALGAITREATRRPPPRMLREESVRGGEAVSASIESLTLSKQGRGEKWEFQFGGRPNSVPEYLVRLIPSDSGQPDEPRVFTLQILLRRIDRSAVSKEKGNRLVSQSRFVRRLLQYPAIEDGDTALELSLKAGIQPLLTAEAVGNRLVIDLHDLQTPPSQVASSQKRR